MIKNNYIIGMLLAFLYSTLVFGNYNILSVNKMSTSEITSNLAFFNNKIYYLSNSAICAYDIANKKEEKVYDFEKVSINSSYYDKDNNEIITAGEGLKKDLFDGMKSIALTPKNGDIFFVSELNSMETNSPASLYSLDLNSKSITQVIKPKQKEFGFVNKPSMSKYTTIGFEWNAPVLRGFIDESIIYLEMKNDNSESRLIFNDIKTNKITIIDSGYMNWPIGIQNYGDKIAYVKYDDVKHDFRLNIWDSAVRGSTRYDIFPTAVCYSPDDKDLISTDRNKLYLVDFNSNEEIEFGANEKLNGLMISDMIWPIKNKIFIINGAEGKMFEIDLAEQ